MNVRIEITYKTPKGTEAIFHTEEMRAKHALLIAEDIEKTGRSKLITFIDRHDHSWTFKELKKQLEEIQTEPHDISVYFDGGFDIKSRKSGLGCVIYYEQNGRQFRIRKNALVEEMDSNNEAEYAAFHLGVQELELLGVHHLPVTFVGDSQVVINQLKGEWPTYEKVLNNWADRIEEDLNRLGIDPEFDLISRTNNREADRLASQALEGTQINSTLELQVDQ
ncbi:ribonuclease H family protein [Oceanobacillus halotolerans]|uniref:ribonuclease H family protein n=1 Tax=Oceanobacillus halotolerans TaxID=2663380 RepID=UPI0013DB8D9C|nr:ribonuclease H family protein [Oceanobacillus halotolerans]